MTVYNESVKLHVVYTAKSTDKGKESATKWKSDDTTGSVLKMENQIYCQADGVTII